MSYSWGSDTTSSWGGSSGGGFNYGSAKKSYKKKDLSKSYSPPSSGKSLNMGNAYTVSSRIIDKMMTKEDMDLLKMLKKTDILVVPGSYDHVENVLDAIKIPHTESYQSAILDPKQVLLVNCPGDNIDSLVYKEWRGTDAISKFVKKGGFAVTTDWALERVIMKSFPGFAVHDGTDTDDDVVEVDLIASKSPYTRGLGEGSLKPIWWLEGSSYPIRIKDDQVDILLGSKEMKDRYGYNPIAIKFPYGQGRVVHVTSHFYLQTTKSKYDAQANKTGLDFATGFLGMDKKTASRIQGIDNVSFGAVESAYTSIKFLQNIFVEKVKRNLGMKGNMSYQPTMRRQRGDSVKSNALI